MLVGLNKSKQLIPVTANDLEELAKYQVGQQFEVKPLREKQNGKLHRKLFSLFNFGYQYFTPKAVHHPFHGEIQPKRNFEQYRAWAVIAAGYYDWIATPKGVRPIARSLKYNQMTAEERASLYSSVLDVIYQQLLDSEHFLDRDNFLDALREFEHYE